MSFCSSIIPNGRGRHRETPSKVLLAHCLGESLCRTLAVGHVTLDAYVLAPTLGGCELSVQHVPTRSGTETNSDSEGDSYNYNPTRTDTDNNGSHDYDSEHKPEPEPEHEYKHKHRPGVARKFTLREITTRVGDGSGSGS